jgi:hypothetical protein
MAGGMDCRGLEAVARILTEKSLISVPIAATSARGNQIIPGGRDRTRAVFTWLAQKLY